jgi:succinate-semialdehyde dehydrogenase/glutarate-semialdehyde dehydrogenase
MTIDSSREAHNAQGLQADNGTKWGAVTFESNLTNNLDSRRGLVIGGERRSGGAGVFEVYDPASGDLVALQADGTAQDAARAVDAAAEALPTWRSTPARDRSVILTRAFELMRERGEDLAVLISRENGKSLADARGEVTYAAEFFRWNAEEAARLRGQWAPDPSGAGARLITVPKPVGPCLIITPWNFPLALATRKLGPALAAGCTVIWKPASETPLCSHAMLDLLRGAGLPDGVVQVLTSTKPGDLVEPLLLDRRLRKLSFTGSTPVGRGLAELAGKGLVRTSLELGGNAPFVVFDDADIPKALDDAMVAKLRNGGQSCVAANRFFLQDSICSDFIEEIAGRFSRLKVGPGLEEGVDVGPLVSRKQRDTTAALVQDAIDRGARLVVGGVDAIDPGPAGTFIAPTVLADVPPGARCLQEEVFGPVFCGVSFADEDEALAMAGDTPHGLAGYVHTRSLPRALRWVESLEIGMLGVNRGLVSNPAAPFGGVKDSGWGKEGGHEGIQEYLSLTYVAMQ